MNSWSLIHIMDNHHSSPCDNNVRHTMLNCAENAFYLTQYKWTHSAVKRGSKMSLESFHHQDQIVSLALWSTLARSWFSCGHISGIHVGLHFRITNWQQHASKLWTYGNSFPLTGTWNDIIMWYLSEVLLWYYK